MPQILRQCGHRPLPHPEAVLEPVHAASRTTAFAGAGIDGSEVLVHMPPVGTYNAELEPDELRGGGGALQRPRPHDASLIVFGHGDGGGGPTPEMLESARRASPTCGACRGRAVDRRAASSTPRRAADELATIVGELYFEYHRGTYTSQARTKRGNRAGERRCIRPRPPRRSRWRGAPRTRPRSCAALWQMLLLQPVPRHPPRARSIREVYETPSASSARCATARDRAARRATAALPGPAGDGAPLNLDGFERRDVLERRRRPALCTRARRTASARAAEPESEVRVERDGDLVRSPTATCGPARRAGRLLEPRSHDGREALSGPADVLELSDDRPTAFDAWELEPYHDDTRRVLPGASAWRCWSRPAARGDRVRPPGRRGERARAARPARRRRATGSSSAAGSTGRSATDPQGRLPAPVRGREGDLRRSVRRP